MKTGKVIGECLPRHRAQEFLRFLKTIDRETPEHLDLDLVLQMELLQSHLRAFGKTSTHFRIKLSSKN